MPTAINRQALEKIYYEAIVPFFRALDKMAEEFDNLFAVIEFPNIDLTLLDDLDHTFHFGWWEFVVDHTINFELEIQIHFNRYDYVLEWKIKDSNFYKRIKKTYDSSFLNVEQLDYTNEIGRFIIDQVKDKYE